jgi:hypothetical protein
MRSSIDRLVPFMPVHDRNTPILAMAVLSLTPLRNRATIVAIRITMFIPVFRPAVLATLKQVAIVVCDPVRQTIIGADRDAHL